MFVYARRLKSTLGAGLGGAVAAASGAVQLQQQLYSAIELRCCSVETFASRARFDSCIRTTTRLEWDAVLFDLFGVSTARQNGYSIATI